MRRHAIWLVSRLSVLMLLFGAVAPVAAQQATPAGAPPRSISREEFQRQLRAKFPFEAAKSKGGTVVVGEAGDISTLNAILTADAPTIYVTGAIYETLVGGSPIDGQIVPALADAWDVSPDGLVYTFHLNKQAKWHDGVDFTADDVKFSFDAVLDPNTGSLYTTTVHEAVASYRVVDPDTFEITARDRLASFLYDAPAAVFIMPTHIWQSVGTESWTFDGGSNGQDPKRVVGTGPFKFKEWVQGDHITLVRNDAYYDVVPTIDQLILRILPDVAAAVQALKTGEVDTVEIVPPEQVDPLRAAGLKVDIYDLFDFTFYVPNLDPERTTLFQDRAVRQALFTALDRDAITKNIFRGYGEAAVGTQPKLSAAYAPDRMTTRYPFDPAKAKQLLAQAGWTDSDGDGTVDKDGKTLKFELLYGGGSATVDQIVAYMQEAWHAIGVEMKPKSLDSSALYQILDNHDFEMALLAFSWTPDGDQGAMFSCDSYQGGFNYAKYCNPEWDKLEQQQKRELNRAKRVQLLIQQSNVIWTDQPISVLRFGVGRTGYNPKLHNFYPSGYGFLWSLPYIWVEE